MFELLKFLAGLIQDIVPKARRLRTESQRRSVATELLDLYNRMNDSVLVGNSIIRELEHVLNPGAYQRANGTGVHLHDLAVRQLDLLSGITKIVYALRYSLGLLSPESTPRLAGLLDNKMTALDWLRFYTVNQTQIYPGWTLDGTLIGSSTDLALDEQMLRIDFVQIPIEGRMTLEQAEAMGLRIYLEEARRRLEELTSIMFNFRTSLIQTFSMDELLLLVGESTSLGDIKPFMADDKVNEISGGDKPHYPYYPYG